MGRHKSLLLGLAAALLGSIPQLAEAGRLQLQGVDAFTTALVSMDLDGDGQRDTELALSDTDGNQQIEFFLADQEKITTYWIEKTSNGSTLKYQVTLNEGSNGSNLAALEPFVYPVFAAGTPILASLDAVEYVSTSSQFGLGQPISVMSGTIMESPAFTFKDASSLPSDAVFSRDLVASLPDFTGTVIVHSFDSATPIPEPSTLAIMCVGVMGVLGYVRRITARRVTSSV